MSYVRVIPLPRDLELEAASFIREILRTEFGVPALLAEMADIDCSYRANGGDFWVAMNENNEICGTIAVRDFGKGCAYLGRLYVSPCMRRCGLGKQLIEVVENACIDRDIESIYLETGEAYQAALSLFKQNGFAVVSRALLPSHISFDEDTTVLRKSLLPHSSIATDPALHRRAMSTRIESLS